VVREAAAADGLDQVCSVMATAPSMTRVVNGTALHALLYQHRTSVSVFLSPWALQELLTAGATNLVAEINHPLPYDVLEVVVAHLAPHRTQLLAAFHSYMNGCLKSFVYDDADTKYQDAFEHCIVKAIQLFARHIARYDLRLSHLTFSDLAKAIVIQSQRLDDPDSESPLLRFLLEDGGLDPNSAIENPCPVTNPHMDAVCNTLALVAMRHRSWSALRMLLEFGADPGDIDRGDEKDGRRRHRRPCTLLQYAHAYTYTCEGSTYIHQGIVRRQNRYADHLRAVTNACGTQMIIPLLQLIIQFIIR
jgi:hypothetical protein